MSGVLFKDMASRQPRNFGGSGNPGQREGYGEQPGRSPKKKTGREMLPADIRDFKKWLLSFVFCIPHKANACEEENDAQNAINGKCFDVADATARAGENYCGVNQSYNSQNGQDGSKNSFDVHDVGF